MSPPQVVILGGGNIGSFVANELVSDGFDVSILDSSLECLNLCKSLTPNVSISTFDATNVTDYESKLSDSTLVVNALPGPIGHSALQNIVNLGLPCVDVSFTSEDPRILKDKVIKSNSLVIADTGIAPGLSNLLSAHLVTNKNIQTLF